jgi:hypothetical protein
MDTLRDRRDRRPRLEYLPRLAPAAGAQTVFLTPGGEAEERIDRRAGFHTVDEILFASRRVAPS